MKRLKEIWQELANNGFETDKNGVHSYIYVYEEILKPYRETAKNILEIGLFDGNSLRMWERYFEGKVYGIDCSETPHDGMADLRPMINECTHNIIIGNAENEIVVKNNFEGIKFDIIFEDAAHNIEQQLKLYEIFKPYLNKGSIYLIEDIQDLEATKEMFLNMDLEKDITILDLRENKKRYDDVLVIIKDK